MCCQDTVMSGYLRETKEVVSSGDGWLISLYLRFPVEGRDTSRFGLGSRRWVRPLSLVLSIFGEERGCGCCGEKSAAFLIP